MPSAGWLVVPFAHAYTGGGQVVFASAYLLNERPRNGTVPWLALDGFGLRVGGQMNYDAKTVLFANGSIEYRVATTQKTPPS